MPRPVALLDVDNTLLFGLDNAGNSILNQNLILSLHRNAVKDVYLFTDMTFMKYLVEERLWLISKLQEYGLIVHGVVTPNDLAWNITDVERLEDLLLSDEYQGNDKYRGRFYGEQFEEFIRTQSSLCSSISTYQPNNTKPGKAFDDAKSALNNDEFSEYFLVKSTITKAFGDRLGAKHGYPHTKGLMLDLFLHHRPDWVGSILVADDNKEVISTFEIDPVTSQTKFKPVDASKTPCPLLTLIPVKNLHHDAQYYDNLIKGHLSKDVHFIVRPFMPTLLLCSMAGGVIVTGVALLILGSVHHFDAEQMKPNDNFSLKSGLFFTFTALIGCIAGGGLAARQMYKEKSTL